MLLDPEGYFKRQKEDRKKKKEETVRRLKKKYAPSKEKMEKVKRESEEIEWKSIKSKVARVEFVKCRFINIKQLKQNQ